MSEGFEDFCQLLGQSFIAELICLITHLTCAIALIYYLLKNKQKTPIIQNSPILTVTAQVMLVLASICLLASKIIIIAQPYKIKQTEPGCYGSITSVPLSLLSSAYSFCIQFMYITYLLKMIRVVLITFDGQLANLFTKIFNNQFKLLLVACTWSGLILMADLIMKIFFCFDDQENHVLHLYPQFNQFLCDVSYGFNQPDIYNIKAAIYLSLFLWSFWKSYGLQQIDSSLLLRLQYIILLLLPYFLWMTQDILKIIKPGNNTSMPVHYMDCLSNLIAGYLLMKLHFNIAKKHDFFLPDESDIDQGIPDFCYLLSNPLIKRTLEVYFQSKNKHKIFAMKVRLVDPDYNHKDLTQEKVMEIWNCLEPTNVMQMSKTNILEKKFEFAKDILDRQFYQLFMNWKKTISGKSLIQKMQNNTRYYRKMVELRLVKRIPAPIPSLSQSIIIQ